MSVELHPLAPHYLQSFVTVPGETDVMFVAVAIFFIVLVLVIGNLYLRLHALPERMAHRGNKAQFQFVAVLALIALFTHQTAFWIAALLLALVPIPDFSTPMARIADSLERLVGVAARAEGTVGGTTASSEDPATSTSAQAGGPATRSPSH